MVSVSPTWKDARDTGPIYPIPYNTYGGMIQVKVALDSPENGCEGYWANIFNAIQNIWGHDSSQGGVELFAWKGVRGVQGALGYWDTRPIYLIACNT